MGKPGHGRQWPAVLAAMGLMCSCTAGQQALESQPVRSEPGPGWRVSLELSGGFAGVAQEFSADSATTTLLAADPNKRIEADRPLDRPRTA